MSTTLKRRSFLKLATAGLAVAAAPSGGAATIAQAIPKAEAAKTTFGYTFDGEYYPECAFQTREEAIRAAQAALAYSHGEHFETAQVAFYSMRYPSLDEYGEAAVDALLNDYTISEALLDLLSGSNEDGDFEGEFSSACNTVGTDTLEPAAKKVFLAALRRAGRDDVASRIEAGADAQIGDDEQDEELLETISKDVALQKDLDGLFRPWVDNACLSDAIRGLMVDATEKHVIPINAMGRNPWSNGHKPLATMPADLQRPEVLETDETAPARQIVAAATRLQTLLDLDKPADDGVGGALMVVDGYEVEAGPIL